MVTLPSPDVNAQIDQLWIYPVKSCAGIAVPEAELTPTGLRWDRHWMVVDSEGEFVTQRELPRMALIQPRLTADGCELTAPGMLPLWMPFGATGPSVRVRVWDDAVNAFDMGEAVSIWLSEFLAASAAADLQRLRLVRFDPNARRACSAKWTGGREAWTQFADGFGILVVSSASLIELNARLAAGGHGPVSMARFRPNIVLSGLEAHDEDRIGPWRIATEASAAVLDNVKPCARCPIPNLDPATALASPEVGDTLQVYRQDRRLGGAVTFGMNAIALAGLGQVLKLGQPVSADWRFD
ncbi:MAG: MOSC N-terminal beta barrel domain-containing protein [Hydrogenophaga sp.]